MTGSDGSGTSARGGRLARPRRFDYNVVVIGAGAGGLVAAYIASALKAKTALVEKHRMGGDCLNTGCVPSKALIRTARVAAMLRRADEFGLRAGDIEVDFAAVMQRVQQVIARIEPHDSTERYSSLGVECIEAEARLLSPWEVRVGDRTLRAANIIIATGGRPRVAAIPGLDAVPWYTSDTIWSLRRLPRRLLVLGGGPIGCELSQCFQRLGSTVTLVQRAAQLLPGEDADMAALVRERFSAEGMSVLTGVTAEAFTGDGERNQVRLRGADGEVSELEFDAVLLALGREPNCEGFGLQELGVTLRSDGTIGADPFMATNYPSIRVCGDVTGPWQYTHVASHQAWYAAVNALFRPLLRFRVDYRVIPRAVYTEPELARVGINEREAVAAGIPVETSTYYFDDLDRAIADGETDGWIKVLTVPGKDRILGVSIVGRHAADIIQEYVLAMKQGIGLNRLLQTIHAYPTLVEANKHVAGAWKRSHAPQAVLRLLQGFHRWRRGGGE